MDFKTLILPLTFTAILKRLVAVEMVKKKISETLAMRAVRLLKEVIAQLAG